MDTSKIFIAAVIAVAFSECLAFYMRGKKQKRGQGNRRNFY